MKEKTSHFESEAKSLNTHLEEKSKASKSILHFALILCMN